MSFSNRWTFDGCLVASGVQRFMLFPASTLQPMILRRSFRIRFSRTAVIAGSLCLSTAIFAEDTPLADALQHGDRSTALNLITGSGDINAVQSDGSSALHWAVYHDDLELAAKLVEQGADVDATNQYGVSPLSLACQNGNGRIVALLLEAGADANTTLPGGETALMTASRTGKVDAVKALLEQGADVDAEERNDQTALMWAAAEGHLGVVETLIAAGADIEARLRSGFTPFFFAVRQGHKDVALRLIEAGVDVNDSIRSNQSSGGRPDTGTTPLILAVENGHFELALALLEAGADPNDARVGYSALHAVSWVRKPLRGDGDPPPIGSGAVSSLEFVRQLVERGADVNLRHGQRNAGRAGLNRHGATPFLLAAETGDLPLMKLLVELGADPSIPNEDNAGPLLAAAGVGILSNGDETAGTEEEAMTAVRFLIDRGADINAVDDNGNTAMHGAAYKSWTKLVELLSRQGADIAVWNRKNDRGWTPLLIAQGYRPGNFRPSAETIDAIASVMREAGIEPPPAPPRK